MFEMEALYQNDPAWENVKLGNQDKETIGSWGCLLTSLTMVVNGYGCDETPETMNEKLKSAGGFQGPLLTPAAVPAVCSRVIYKGYQPCEDSPAPLSKIDAAIAAGKPVIVQVDWSPRAGLQTHWVVLYDKDGDDYYMMDPYRFRGDVPGKKLKLLDRYTHSGRNAARAITGVIWLEGATPPLPAPKADLPDDSINVFAAVEGLAFRDAPSVSGILLKRLPLNALLQTLETKSAAVPKIGVSGEWLHVQDSAAQQGYVAAWYVSRSVAVEGTEPQKPPPLSVDDVEYYLIPIAAGLAVRARPSVSGQLLRRVPLGTKFGYLESKDEVNRKVGVINEWIHIYDASGLEGYVAAWYVTRKAGEPPTRPGKIPPPESKPETGQLTVVPITAGLAFRRSPLVNPSTLIERLPLRIPLTVLDADANSKVGVRGQWLKVKTPTGQRGYVAAWYVKPAERPDSEAAPGATLTLRTTAEGVALRTVPMIADHTLLKRLPAATLVTALEPGAEAKLGKVGEWLRVRDASGVEGYLAAWYVVKA